MYLIDPIECDNYRVMSCKIFIEASLKNLLKTSLKQFDILEKW